ncbi:hypothetical protein AAC387_Pa02g4480 [Persea americana]
MSGETNHDGINKETSHDGTGPSSEEPKNMPDWLIDIVNQQELRRLIKMTEEQAEQSTRPKTRIQKVDKTLRTESNSQCFDPLVVSLGPYHHGKEHLMSMEQYKNVAAAWFILFATGNLANDITNMEAINIYQKFVEKATSKDCYADNFDDKYNEADLMRMMFLDGCFILHFIHLLVTGSSDDLTKSSHNLDQPCINLFGDDEPLHLLDILRAVLIGTGPSPDCSHGSGYWYCHFRPIRELKATSIHVRRSKTRTLRDVQFQKGILDSHLEIPQIIVDASTKTRLINLVAYEMCSDGPKDRTVTSYVCLLHSLIYNADDAEELQSKNILLNRLGSNEDVAILFKELATNLSPHYNAYGLVINGIKGHFKRHFNNERVRIGKWIGQFMRTYFSSPWTLTSLIAAAFIIVLTLLQTIYTMWGFYKTY